MQPALRSEPTPLTEQDLNRPYSSIEEAQSLFEERGFEVTVEKQKPGMTQALYLRSEWKQLDQRAAPLVYRPDGQKKYFLTHHGKQVLTQRT